MGAILQTPRLHLREITESDAADIYRLDLNPEVMKYVGRSSFDSVDACRLHIRNKILPVYQNHPGYGVLLAEDRATKQFLGWFHMRPAYLYRFASEANYAPGDFDLGFRLRQECWGGGLATEGSQALIKHAFRSDECQRIVACAMVGNSRSRRVLEKCGLREEATFEIPGYVETLVRYVQPRATNVT